MKVDVLSFAQDNARSKPAEDFGSITRFKNTWAFAVADGVSRTGGYYSQLGKPSSSCIVATAFCHTSAPALATGKSLHEAFAFANEKINGINEAAGFTPETVDYLDRDYLCCTAVAGALAEEYPDKFIYGYIGDCGILVYDADYMPVFLSENNVGILEGFREGSRFSDKNERRIFWRKKLRNRSERFMTYGALTGEPAALAQVTYGYVDLKAGDTVLLFSDGIYPFIFDQVFRVTVTDLLRKSVVEAEIWGTLESCIKAATVYLQYEGAKNLDDDKTMIAFRV